jgi:hypothetical protein
MRLTTINGLAANDGRGFWKGNHPMAKSKQQLIQGMGQHRRTESDYMGAILDTVTLDDWREVIAETLRLAKEGDPQARGWLAQYLVGKPEAKAPTPLNVVVQQWSGADPLISRLAKPIISKINFPNMHKDDDFDDQLRAAIAVELAQKLPPPETAETPATAGNSSDSAM